MTKVSDSADWPSDRPRSGQTAPKRGGPSEIRPSDRLDLTTSPWHGAFKAAGQHSARVRFLRRATLFVAVIAVALILGVALFDPFRRLPRNISIGQVSVNGTHVTVASPKISGYQTDGRPYEVRARSGAQDTTTPSILDLSGVEAEVGMMDDSTVHVTSVSGVYDGASQKMTLRSEVRIQNDRVGYDIRANTATIDFDGGVLASDEPVTVFLNGGTVSANTMDIRDNGHKVSFAGAVKSLIEPADDDQPVEAPAGRRK